jgi:hypothetical protein
MVHCCILICLVLGQLWNLKVNKVNDVAWSCARNVVLVVELIRCISGVYCRRQGFLWVGFQHFRRLCGLSAGLDLHNQLSSTCWSTGLYKKVMFSGSRVDQSQEGIPHCNGANYVPRVPYEGMLISGFSLESPHYQQLWSIIQPKR